MKALLVGKALYDILTSDTVISPLLGRRIYPVVAEQGTTFPFVVWRRTGMEPANTKDKYVYNSNVSIDLVIVSSDYTSGLELAEAITNCLTAVYGVHNDIDIVDIKLNDCTEDYQEVSYIQTLNFSVRVR